MNTQLALSEGLILPNRLMKSSSSCGLYTDNHEPTERCLQLYRRIARAKPGIMILEDAFVHNLGEYRHPELSLADDNAITAHTRILEAIREISPETKIFAELGHAGDKGSLPINEATTEELSELPRLYLMAARRAIEAGYDGAQLHAGHTNLLSRSMSSAFNERIDKYEAGDELLNEVVSALYDVVQMFPISLKLQADEFMAEHGGITPEQTVARIAKMSFPFCFIELCGGTTDKRSIFMGQVNKLQTYYYKHVITAISQAGLLPKYKFAVTGGMDLETAEEALQDGCALVGFCRQFLRDETFEKRCLRCNRCADMLLESGSGECVLYRNNIE